MVRLTNRKAWSDDIDLTQELGYKHIYQRLAEYENLEEQGLLVKLPCKVGDMVRGEWLFRCIAGEDPYLCSLCGNTVDVYGYGYCPNCGAYMEGEDNG